MEILNIDLQDIADAAAMGQEAPHRSLALTHIENGGTVNVTQNGTLIGRAATIAELEALLG